MNLATNTFLRGGTYKIVRFIGSGGFGCTYEAKHVLLNKRVAIKEFFVKDFCNRDERTAHVTVGTVSKKELVNKLKNKFLDEARSVCQLEHPNIVRVTDVFEENGTAYYVMDYVDGRSLSDLVNSCGPLPEYQALGYIRQVADALIYVHSHNRLHLDIKPANIMLDKGGNAVLIDFGASKQYDEVNGENTSTLMGKTPGYAPPEQMGNDVVKFTPPTDIYALGATLYKLLTGITPPSATLRISGEELPPLPEGTSEKVAQAIKEAMQVNKTMRPQSVADFLKIIYGEEPLEAVVVDVSKVKVVDTDPENVVKDNNKSTADEKKKGFSLKWIAAFVLICIVAFAVTFIAIKPSDNTPKAENTEVEGVQQDFNGTTFTYTGTVDANGIANGEGEGVYDGGTYKGRYVNGSRDGQGTFTTSDGKNSFTGTFLEDKYSIGRLTDEDGSYFEGSFKDGQPYTGAWYNKDGSIYCKMKQGQMKN